MHAFPFQQDNPKGPQRTHDKLIDDAKSAFETQSTVHGVKGPTWLSKLESFDLIRGNAVDYMHSVLLGVMCLLMFCGPHSCFHFVDKTAICYGLYMALKIYLLTQIVNAVGLVQSLPIIA